MGFLFFLVYLVLFYLRPWELNESLQSLPIMPVATIAGVLGTVASVALGRGPSLRSPQAYLVLLFLAWTVSSFGLAAGWFGGTADVLERLQPPVLIFFLAFLNVDTVSRFRITSAVLGLLSLFLAGQGIAAYHFGYQTEKLLLVGRMAEEEVDFEDEAEGGSVVRILSVGALADPNDLAQALLSFSPFLLAFRRPGSLAQNLFVVGPALAGILYAVALTKSRGSLVALVALAYFALRHRLGRTLSLGLGAIAALGLVGLGLTEGRTLSMDESSEGRVDAWAAGLRMLRGSPVWGVGFGQFAEVHNLVAHNSFVHCFSETGLVGYFLWLLLVALTLRESAALAKADGEGNPGADLAQAGRGVFLSLVGFLAAAFFLSRTYSSVLFLILGLGAALSDIARRRGLTAAQTPLLRWIPIVLGIEVGSVLLVRAVVVVVG